MVDFARNFVLGYHGCEREIGEEFIKGKPFKLSENDYDWLGPGVYFWEADPLRGLEWAQAQAKRKKLKEPFVVGAVVDLGRCLDLFSRVSIKAVQATYDALIATHNADPSLGPLPVNEHGDDLLRRHLDCAVIRHFHAIRRKKNLPAYDSVRGLFREGKPIYTNSGFYAQSHIQIAVCNPEKILGVFRVPGDHFS